MYKKQANILIILIIILSLVQLIFSLDIFLLSSNFVIVNFTVFYSLLIMLFAFLLYRFFIVVSNTAKNEKITSKISGNERTLTENNENVSDNNAQEVDRIINSVLFDLEYFDDHSKLSEKLLSNFSKTFDIVQGIVYLKDVLNNNFSVSNTFAFYKNEIKKSFLIGEGITGQVAKNKKFLYMENVPENYITVLSGLGSSTPKFLTLVPIIKNDETIAIIEFATFSALPKYRDEIFEVISEKLVPYFDKYIISYEEQE